LQSTGIAKQRWTADRIEKFEYPAMPFSLAVPSVPNLEAFHEEASRREREESELRASEDQAKKFAEETRRAFDAGHERGLAEGRQIEREAHVSASRAAEEKRSQQAAQLIEKFAQERERYLQEAEKEVVKLALAVAARILRREAQMDPLLLTGAVRVALGQLGGSTEVRLGVPAGELEMWKDALALLPNLSVKPQVIAGDGMRLGDCVIDTALGSVDIGIRSQLGEIERGFFDGAIGSGGSAAEPALAAAGGGGA
jgi:flagellar assembly protein FliH